MSVNRIESVDHAHVRPEVPEDGRERSPEGLRPGAAREGLADHVDE
jgi:hypothetical protein